VRVLRDEWREVWTFEIAAFGSVLVVYHSTRKLEARYLMVVAAI
jgi:hypothetical protein